MSHALVKALALSLVEIMYAFENDDDDFINSDYAVKLMEYCCANFIDLDSASKAELIAVLQELAAEAEDKNTKAFLENSPDYFGILD